MRPSGPGAYNGPMNRFAEIIAPLAGRADAEPWVHFCVQCLERKQPCVLVTIEGAPAGAPCEKGEHFVYDAHGHGLLPRDIGFSVALHRLTRESLRMGAKSEVTLPTPSGEIQVNLEPYCPGQSAQ